MVNELNILALAGPSRSGKTVTLQLVHDWILANGGESTRLEILGTPTQKDFSDIVIWQGERIGFFTTSDYSRALMNAFREYAKYECKVLICACNTRLIRPQCALTARDATRLEKMVVPEPAWDMANTADAQRVIDNLQELIRE